MFEESLDFVKPDWHVSLCVSLSSIVRVHHISHSSPTETVTRVRDINSRYGKPCNFHEYNFWLKVEDEKQDWKPIFTRTTFNSDVQISVI